MVSFSLKVMLLQKRSGIVLTHVSHFPYPKRRVASTPDRSTFEKYQDTAHRSISRQVTFPKAHALLLDGSGCPFVWHTRPICITRCLFTEVSSSGVVGTPFLLTLC